MYDSIESMLADLPHHIAGIESRLAGVKGLYCLKVRDGRVFYISIEDGKLSFPLSAEREPDCTVEADEKTVLDLFSGKLSPMKAMLTRRVSWHGNIGELVRLAGLFL